MISIYRKTFQNSTTSTTFDPRVHKHTYHGLKPTPRISCKNQDTNCNKEKSQRNKIAEMGYMHIPRKEFEGADANTESRGRSWAQVFIFFGRSRAPPPVANSRPAIHKKQKQKQTVRISRAVTTKSKLSNFQESAIFAGLLRLPRNISTQPFIWNRFDCWWEKVKCSDFMAKEAGDDDRRDMGSVGTTAAHHTHHLFLCTFSHRQSSACFSSGSGIAYKSMQQ